MASHGVHGLLWIYSLLHVSRGEELSRELVVSWVRGRVLDSLGLDEPPPPMREGVKVQLEAGRLLHHRVSRSTTRDPPTGSSEDSSQMILFPSSDSTCVQSNSFTYRFNPSINIRGAVLTSADFWFYTGQSTNSSALLFIISVAQRHRAADAPSVFHPDGWVTYNLDGSVLPLVAEGPFQLQIICNFCHGHKDKTPFLQLHVHPRGPARFARSATVPWSPSAVNLLQRPSHEASNRRDCQRAELNISFEELGWDSWIVHPKAITFHYCDGNCSARDGATSPLDGITQCCAPVPGTMKSLKITTTSDGGFSFRHETLPNIIPEECACI